MVSKTSDKEKAVKLRRKGRSYSEILKEVSVAKSTLSIWLRSVGLSQPQKQRLTDKKMATIKKGGERKREIRISTTKRIKDEARGDIGQLSIRDLWLFGVALYWAEGQKERGRGSLVALGNSDPFLIKVFLRWLIDICEVPRNDIHFWIFLHETAAEKLLEVQKYWSQATGFSLNEFRKVTWKRNQINSNRKNRGESYHGLLRVIVRRSTNLNRRIQGWVEGINIHCGIV
ncbi:MAG: hypothetical protein NTY31_02200 [Candidatus Falkowbacteria bacterium]|nr:hypothetical protein [Candidatus Falkowbacteria bacterium]